MIPIIGTGFQRCNKQNFQMRSNIFAGKTRKTGPLPALFSPLFSPAEPAKILLGRFLQKAPRSRKAIGQLFPCGVFLIWFLFVCLSLFQHPAQQRPQVLSQQPKAQIGQMDAVHGGFLCNRFQHIPCRFKPDKAISPGFPAFHLLLLKTLFPRKLFRFGAVPAAFCLPACRKHQNRQLRRTAAHRIQKGWQVGFQQPLGAGVGLDVHHQRPQPGQAAKAGSQT